MVKAQPKIAKAKAAKRKLGHMTVEAKLLLYWVVVKVLLEVLENVFEP